MTEVSLKHVGIVLGLELSRLSRSCKDWHHLIEVCGVFGALLGDEDSIYDPLDSNDRLLLGMKGAMSEFELVTIKNRLTRGVQNKAARGELILSVPIGYVKLSGGEVVKDPDEQARSMVELVFEKFEETGSAYGVFRYLADNQLKMGFRLHKGPRRGELEFRLPTSARVLNILKHPIYAGAYGYAMRRNCKMHRNVDNLNEKGWFLSPEDMGVCLRDRMPAYITWDQYLANQAKLQENRSTRKSKGIPRRGDALLAGLVRCGRCHRQMITSYKTDKLPSYCCDEFVRNQTLEGYCGRLAAKWIDELVSSQVLRAVAPAAIELSEAATKEIEIERQHLHRQWNLKIERAQQECDRARRRYEAVEPENRLVARTLESDWEALLIDLQNIEDDYERFKSTSPIQLSDQEKLRIKSLSSSVPEVWRAESTTNEHRKIIIRCLVDQVILTIEDGTENVDVTILWQGGFRSQHAICKAVGSYSQLSDYEQLCKRIEELHRQGLHHREIAAQLNEEGFRTARRRGKFTTQNVGDLIRRLNLRGELFRDGMLGKDEWWIPDLADKLGVIQQKVHYWARQGWVHSRRTPTGKHWIVWADREELRRLRKLKKLHGSYIAKNHPVLVTPKDRPSDPDS
ncbi:Recombinase [Stieleria magnilauensis]|nr:Recombinase [Planctomycetes bacterium TBK1r]